MSTIPFSQSSRGQTTMPDVLFATLLFFLVLTGLIYYAENLQSSSRMEIERRNLDVSTANVAEFIIKNPGTPYAWETLGDTNQIVQIGLAQKDRVLLPAKVVAFVNLGNTDYTLAKARLTISYYDFYAEFSGGVNFTTGVAPPPDVDVSVVERLVTINGVETRFRLIMYAP